MPVLRCTNGTSVSVQAGFRNYCTPRNDSGPYSKVELMVWGGSVPRYLTPYKNDTVYSYVPVQLIDRLIQDGGGLGADNQGELPAFNPQPYEEAVSYTHLRAHET